jgi:P27 family predicted phage terminase small subunit
MPGRTPSPDSINSTDKRPKTVSDGIIPRPPTWLNDNAKKIYKAASKEIVNLGIAGKCDVNVLSIYAMQLDRLQALSQKENKDPSENRALNDLTASTLSLIKELGISPSARAKLRIAKVDDSDALTDFMDDK